MHITRLMHQRFQKQLNFVHKSRLGNLMLAVETSVKCNKLYLTGIGREISNRNKTGSNIQKMDRLLGNTHLLNERQDFYKLMIDQLITSNNRPIVHIDWTCINSTTNLYVLRAGLSMKGRSIVLYEECYPKREENNHKTHMAFLKQLKNLLPSSAKPIIVTDAGFRTPWFRQVNKLGWDFVGRLRNKNKLYFDNDSHAELSGTLYQRVTSQPNYIGQAKLTEKHKLSVHLVLYKEKNKHRHKLNKYKKVSCSGKSKRYKKAQKEPWLLVTSLAPKAALAKSVVKIYSQRMRIEENIRDTKCPHYGLGLKLSLSRSTARINILLLIAAIATFIAWLAGIFTLKQGRAADFQAHSAKIVCALSIVYLGREVCKKALKMTKNQFQTTLKALEQYTFLPQMEISL